jgi:hypothetical protein
MGLKAAEYALGIGKMNETDSSTWLESPRAVTVSEQIHAPQGRLFSRILRV